MNNGPIKKDGDLIETIYRLNDRIIALAERMKTSAGDHEAWTTGEQIASLALSMRRMVGLLEASMKRKL
jgi:hypothetical protein